MKPKEMGLVAVLGAVSCCPTAAASDDDGANPGERTEKYEAYVFISALVAMVCCCCCSCIMKRIQGMVDGSSAFHADWQSGQEYGREDVFRNSLADSGEVDWACPVCRLDNRPRAAACQLCGTERSLAIHKHAQLQKASMQIVMDVPITATHLTSRQRRTASRLRWRREQHPTRDMLVWRRNQASSFPAILPPTLDPWAKEPSLEAAINPEKHRILTSMTPPDGSVVASAVPVNVENGSSDGGRRGQKENSLTAPSLAGLVVARTDGKSFEWVDLSSTVAAAQAPLPPPAATPTGRGSPTQRSRPPAGAAWLGQGLEGDGSQHDSLLSPLLQHGGDIETGDGHLAPSTASCLPSAGLSQGAWGGNARRGSESGSSTGGSERDGWSFFQSSADRSTTSASQFEGIGDAFLSTFDGQDDRSSSAEPVMAGAARSAKAHTPQAPYMPPVSRFVKPLPADEVLSDVLRRNSPDDSEQYTVPLVTELVEASRSTFRSKHLWFEYALDRIQVPWSAGHIQLEVPRADLLNPSVQQLMALDSHGMRQLMRVLFVGEPGVDVGGLEREWFLLVSQTLFAPEQQLFRMVNGSSGYSIDPSATSVHQLQLFEFTGRVLGKALMERQSLPMALATGLYKHVLRAPVDLGDLESIDPELYRSVTWLRRNPVDALELDFSVTRPDSAEPVDLKPNGRNVPVTDANKDQYVQLLLRWHLVHAVEAQLWHLLRGLYTVVPAELLSVFDHAELEFLLCGAQTIDVDDWKRHTEYLGSLATLGPEHQVVKWFWLAVEHMTESERSRLFQFCTGSSRVPAQGFKALQRNDGKYQRFGLESSSQDYGHATSLPHAHTCFNRLDLPVYKSFEDVRDSLSIVINMDVTGFSTD